MILLLLLLFNAYSMPFDTLSWDDIPLFAIEGEDTLIEYLQVLPYSVFDAIPVDSTFVVDVDYGQVTIMTFDNSYVKWDTIGSYLTPISKWRSHYSKYPEECILQDTLFMPQIYLYYRGHKFELVLEFIE